MAAKVPKHPREGLTAKQPEPYGRASTAEAAFEDDLPFNPFARDEAAEKARKRRIALDIEKENLQRSAQKQMELQVHHCPQWRGVPSQSTAGVQCRMPCALVLLVEVTSGACVRGGMGGGGLEVK